MKVMLPASLVSALRAHLALDRLLAKASAATPGAEAVDLH